jgi:hypothetical protein
MSTVKNPTFTFDLAQIQVVSKERKKERRIIVIIIIRNGANTICLPNFV